MHNAVKDVRWTHVSVKRGCKNAFGIGPQHWPYWQYYNLIAKSYQFIHSAAHSWSFRHKSFHLNILINNHKGYTLCVMSLQTYNLFCKNYWPVARRVVGKVQQGYPMHAACKHLQEDVDTRPVTLHKEREPLGLVFFVGNSCMEAKFHTGLLHISGTNTHHTKI